jgi:hypothetical protein
MKKINQIDVIFVSVYIIYRFWWVRILGWLVGGCWVGWDGFSYDEVVVLDTNHGADIFIIIVMLIEKVITFIFIHGYFIHIIPMFQLFIQIFHPNFINIVLSYKFNDNFLIINNFLSSI